MGVGYEIDPQDEHIYWARVESPFTWEEYDRDVERLMQQIRTLNYPVAIVSDVRKLHQLPGGGLRHLQINDSLIPENVQVVIILGASVIVSTLLSLLSWLRPKARKLIAYANSEETARQIARERLGLPARNGR
ncbi:MAG: hypothetical protein KF726_03680 [Anaerolineae bacterium]|nr:hypothetical protein [Anaerolineae bacterium]